LLTLAEKPGIVYSRLQLLKAALEDELLNVERTVDAHISRLRKKLKMILPTRNIFKQSMVLAIALVINYELSPKDILYISLNHSRD
jgi:hypothetical protein